MGKCFLTFHFLYPSALHKIDKGKRGLVVEGMATAGLANPAPMASLSKSTNGGLRGPPKPPGQHLGFLADALQPSAPKKITSTPQSSKDIQ